MVSVSTERVSERAASGGWDKWVVEREQGCVKFVNILRILKKDSC